MELTVEPRTVISDFLSRKVKYFLLRFRRLFQCFYTEQFWLFCDQVHHLNSWSCSATWCFYTNSWAALQPGASTKQFGLLCDQVLLLNSSGCSAMKSKIPQAEARTILRIIYLRFKNFGRKKLYYKLTVHNRQLNFKLFKWFFYL